jgi:hypothetical protein
MPRAMVGNIELKTDSGAALAIPDLASVDPRTYHEGCEAKSVFEGVREG